MESQWNDAAAAAQPEWEGLLYASRLVGADQALVLWGGGNTSAKVVERDFRGREVPVMRVKGSGSDLRTIQPRDFPGVRLDDVLPLQTRDALSDEAMVAYLAHTLLEPTSPRPSIETLLHAFVPARFVIHTHADAILALTNTPQGQHWVREALGAGALWVPYQRPGFALSKLVAQAVTAHPDATGVVLEKHGLITWGDTARQAYDATVDLVTRAESFIAGRSASQRPAGSRPAGSGPMAMGSAVAPAPTGTPAGSASGATLGPEPRRRLYTTLAPLLRGLAARTTTSGEVLPPSQTREITRTGRQLLHFDDSADVLDFLSLPDAQRLSQIGPATPDHLISTKRTPLFVPLPARSDEEDGGGVHTEGRVQPDGEGTESNLAGAFAAALEPAWRAWVADYVRYVQAAATGAGEAIPEVMDPRPRVVLLPGVGMITLGRDVKATRIAADIYHHAIATVRDAEAVEAYESLTEADCYGVEYWPLELYKLTLAPPEAELARKIAIVTGAASGIGRAIAERFCREGACVTISDINLEGARQLTGEMNAKYGPGRAIAVKTNVADEAGVAALFDVTIAAFGGLDVLVSNAGIAPYGAIDETSLSDWQRSLDVNATGHFLVTREAIKLFKRQGIGGNVIFIATKNTMAPGKEFGAYSAAKSAQAQLARVAAMEGGEFGIRVNMVNPDAVFRGSSLWSPELRRSRAEAHGTTDEGLEDYYRKRNLLGQPIYPEDIAEAAWWLATERTRKSTGSVLSVDGGVAAAFPR
jgi:rhamnose utilization protein RhaD (predicted bifunctional aldolase and dehydrogenase)/NAD(P)-dependent dehydrogenase (short-subunit alcohol dehydrogenase family)